MCEPFLVGVRRLELPTSTSRTWRAANCATPRAPLISTAKIRLFLDITITFMQDFFTAW